MDIRVLELKNDIVKISTVKIDGVKKNFPMTTDELWKLKWSLFPELNVQVKNTIL